MLACYGCTNLGCYKDKDEVIYFNHNLAGRNENRLLKSTMNHSDGSNEEDLSVKGIERASAKRLAGPKSSDI